MEESGCEIIFGNPTIFAVKGLMMMIMKLCRLWELGEDDRTGIYIDVREDQRWAEVKRRRTQDGSGGRVLQPWATFGLNQRIRDLTGPLHWFPVATDRITGPGPKLDRGLWGRGLGCRSMFGKGWRLPRDVTQLQGSGRAFCHEM